MYCFSSSSRAEYLLCVDSSLDRLRRLDEIMQYYLPAHLRSAQHVEMRHGNGAASALSMLRHSIPLILLSILNVEHVTVSCHILLNTALVVDFREQFDRVLVDVPTSEERNAFAAPESSLFSASRSRERLALPRIQRGLLLSAIRTVKVCSTDIVHDTAVTYRYRVVQNIIVLECITYKCANRDSFVRRVSLVLQVGGTVVFCARTLSGLQSEALLESVLEQLEDEPAGGPRVALTDLSLLARTFSDAFRFAPAQSARYGLLVLPALPLNHGPLYMAKLVRTH